MTAIKYWGKDDAQCIRIRHPDGLYIADDFIVTHNTTAICWEAFRLSMTYSGNFGFMGRKRGSDFKTTTLRTFQKVIPPIYEHKKQEHLLVFPNGSEIFYGGLDNREDIEKFNSMELGFFAIDQAEEISFDDWTALAGTLRFELPGGGRPQYRGILSCNPRKCWLKDKFIIRPNEDYRFIQALPSSNPSDGAPDYIARLKELYKDKPRLLRAYIDGSWDDLEGTNTLIPMDKINAAVDRILVTKDREPVIISCDVARFGEDETVLYVWKGLKIIDQRIYGKTNTMETVGNIVVLAKKHNANFIIVDNVIHTGIYDRLMEMNYPVIGFVGSEKASDPIKYKEGKVKMEMWDIAAEAFGKGEVSIPNDPVLINQLSSITYEVVSDSGLRITPKESLSKTLGQSPDRADSCAMGIYCYKTYGSFWRGENYDEEEEESPVILGRTGYG
jgi:hypothetical protein